jgi:hypothetical protein
MLELLMLELLWLLLTVVLAWARPHRTLGLQTPENRSRPAAGPICSRPVLNGLHQVYERAA